MSDKDLVKVEQYIPYVAGVGLVGLITSLYLLTDFSEPLLNVVREYLEHFSS
jgi:hypothetical protein